MTTTQRVPVVVIGGGLVGLSTAMFLAEQQVPCLLVERHDGTSRHPRARGINPRAMELMRSVGLEKSLRGTLSARALADNNGIIAMESLAGREVGALQERYAMDVHSDISGLTPSPWCLCHQDEFEPLLRARAAEFGADLRFGTELVSWTQDEDGVTLNLYHHVSSATETIRADYVVVADGASSRIRTQLDIPFEGSPVLGNFLNIHFVADLREPLGDRRFVMAYTFGPLRSALMPLDNAERWLLHVGFDPATQPVESFTEERCVELIKQVAGIDDLRVRVLRVMPWESAGRTASTFRAGRLFLAGDAAHVMPPTGAFGSNTGVVDAHNLAWKLGAVLRGDAGVGLLDSYDSERRPVCAATVEQALLRTKDRPRMAQEAPAPADPRIVPDSAIWFGGRYRSSAIVGDSADDADENIWVTEPDGRPGTRAPHVALRRSGADISTLDLFGSGFVLLTGPDGAAWQAAAAQLSTPIEVYRIGSPELVDVKDQWTERYSVKSDGAVLVRPDGIVAWRATELPVQPSVALDEAVATILHSPVAV